MSKIVDRTNLWIQIIPHAIIYPMTNVTIPDTMTDTIPDPITETKTDLILDNMAD